MPERRAVHHAHGSLGSMSASAINLRLRRARPSDLLAAAACATYLLAFTVVVFSSGSQPLLGIIALPLAIGPVALLRRRSLSRVQRVVLGATAVLAAAFYVSPLIDANPRLAFAVPVAATAAIACARFPVPSLIAVFFMAGAFGSMEAFLGTPAQQGVDLLLLGVWLGTLTGWLLHGSRATTAWAWPGLVVIALYAAFTAVEILLAEPLIAGVQSFRASTWYLAAVLLVAFAPWPPGARRTLLRGMVAVAALIGAYASFRWVVGPAGSEEELALRSANNTLDGELRPVGSFATSKELAAWTAMMVPFLAAMALTLRDRWRLVAAVGCAACIVGMLAADVRAGPAAAAPGVALVLVLYLLSGAFGVKRIAVGIAATAAVVLGGAAAFTLTLADKQDTGNRYRAILNPTEDPSMQARLIKWRAAMNDIDTAPFGHGLGTSGRAQERYARFVNIGSNEIDSSYLKIAYEQGFIVMIVYAAALLLVLAGLARRAVLSREAARAGPALAACGTLVAMLLLFSVGNYVEGLQALAGWLVIGLGISQFTAPQALSDAA